MSILRKRTEDVDIKKYCVEYLEKVCNILLCVSYKELIWDGEKFLFQIKYGILSQCISQQGMSILRKRTEDIDIKKYCVEYLEQVCIKCAYVTYQVSSHTR